MYPELKFWGVKYMRTHTCDIIYKFVVVVQLARTILNTIVYFMMTLLLCGREMLNGLLGAPSTSNFHASLGGSTSEIQLS